MSDLLIDVSGTLKLSLHRDEGALPEVPWDRDIREELDRSTTFTNANLVRDGGWWMRRLDQIDGVTIHHTLSNSPHATAAHYVKKDGGRPSIPYTIWVTETGEILLCVSLEEGLWHDHTGHQNTHLSVGMAGSLHINKPSLPQLQATIKVCAWAIRSGVLPSVTHIEQIHGHMDYIATTCPGWRSAASGNWRGEFYERLASELAAA